MERWKVAVDFVIPGSIADELGIEKGDELLSINGQKPKDLIDYRFLCADENLELEVKKNTGEVWVCDIEKEFDEDLGLGFVSDTFDGVRNCANRCLFCFVDQMPGGLRESLYVKDDDYRLSFLHGNFITLTNLTDRDMDRITSLKISPLYISVHCTDPELRKAMLGNPRAAGIMVQLKRLAEAGIDMHTQIVLCPGINDGRELKKSISDLSSLWPRVKSLAIVPVGLTRFRDNLHQMRTFTASEAADLINGIHGYQEEFLNKYGSPLVYLADEFYVLAGKEFPPAEKYDGYPQLENGVGMVRLFYDSFAAEEENLPQALEKAKRIALVTGISGAYVLRPIVDRLNRIENLQVELIGTENSFFGPSVTVAGLLTAGDIAESVKKFRPFDAVLLPSVMCKRDEPIFLDGKSVRDLEKELGTSVRVININEGAEDLVEVINKL